MTARLYNSQANLSNTFAETIRYDSDHAASENGANAPISLGATVAAGDNPEAPKAGAEAHLRDRPVFGEVRIVIDEVC